MPKFESYKLVYKTITLFLSKKHYIQYLMNRKLSSFDIYVIVTELQNYIDYNIEKIYQISSNEIVIKIKNIKLKKKKSLYIKNSEYITITDKQFKTPKKPTTFAMTLRKYLTNGKISEITQYEFDRIIELKIIKKDIEYILIIEFFSKGNIILLNSEKKIILPLITQHWSHRKIKTNEIYLYPPHQINPFTLKIEQFSNLIKESKSDLVRTLAVNINLSGPISEEICEIANINKNKKIKKIKKDEIEKIFKELKKFLKKFVNKKISPVIVLEKSEIIDILPFKFKSYKKNKFEKVNSFIKSFEKIIIFEKTNSQKNKVNSEIIEKLKRRINQQKETIKKLQKKIKEKKIEGDIIYLNYDKCEKLINEISEILSLKNKEEAIRKIKKDNPVKKIDLTKNIVNININDINEEKYIIKLNFRKTVAENAEKAYDERKKFKIKLKGAEKSLEKTKLELKNAINDHLIIKKNKKQKSIEKKYWFENYRWFISIEGNIIIAGKDSKSNERIVKKYLKQGDRYAHADIIGAPSCIIKNIDIHNKQIPINKKTLSEACIFSACYSKAWGQYSEVQSYWVLPEQVSKTPQSGEYVPKGGFIIRGKRNYCKCNLEMAIGEIFIDNNKKIMGGPIESVKNYSKKYVLIKPGNIKKNTVAEKIAKEFEISSDHIMKILPPGNINIIESFGLNLDLKEFQ
jgi:predicted ribosome quality control (RQC) complex YloA/Tae2 family protein